MAPAPVSYTYRPRPFAAETRLELGRKELIAWQADSKSICPYHSIETIRLFFSPRGIDFSGYSAKIYARDGRTIALEDRTFKSLAQIERHSGAYRAFVAALCRRVAAENPRVLFHAGRNRFILMMSGAAGAMMTGTLAVLGGRAAFQGQYLLSATVLGFTALFGAWSWRYVTRNWPRTFSADDLPDAVLPPPEPPRP